MIIIGLVLASLAALLHVYIFYLESIAWTGATARKTFGITTEEFAESTRGLAFNQGFYNLFLALDIFAGLTFLAADSTHVLKVVGITLILVGTGSMTAAGLVLLLSDRSKWAAACKQLTLPALSTVFLICALIFQTTH